MAWADLELGILEEFADSSRPGATALDFEDRAWMHLTDLSLVEKPHQPWSARSKAWLQLRNERRRLERAMQEKRPHWRKGLVLVDPDEARARDLERRRRRYREVPRDRELARIRAREWWRRNRERENAKARIRYWAKKHAELAAKRKEAA